MRRWVSCRTSSFESQSTHCSCSEAYRVCRGSRFFRFTLRISDGMPQPPCVPDRLRFRTQSASAHPRVNASWARAISQSLRYCILHAEFTEGNLQTFEVAEVDERRVELGATLRDPRWGNFHIDVR